MTKFRLFCTEAQTCKEVVPADGQCVRLYTCGPTVYNFAHIGNFRTYVFEDLMRRAIVFFGMQVQHVMNLTDVDDKTIQGAREQGISLYDFTAPFKQAFFEDCHTLGILPAHEYPEATAYIAEMVRLIEVLRDKGIAYRGADGSMYYAIHKFPHYGRLSHLHIEELTPNMSQRVADEYDKEHAADFVLWKSYDPARDGGVFWDSPFGKGRPGWHIECSAMSMQLLGEVIDIHAGGVDNIFPHHENEIAQSEACTGRPFVRIWVHAEHLLVDHRKMSKSLGNFYTLRDLLQKGYTGRQIRFLLLSTHYRMPLNFTLQGLDAAAAALERVSDFLFRLRRIHGTSSGKTPPLLAGARTAFQEALAEDLHISVALAVLFELIREVNALCDEDKIDREEASEIIDFLHEVDRVLHVLPLAEETFEIPLELEQLLVRRNDARQQQQWELADECRDLIAARGYRIEDTPFGAKLKKIE